MRLRTSAAAVASGLALAVTATLGLAVPAQAAPSSGDKPSPQAKAAKKALDRIESALAGEGTTGREISASYRDLFVNKAALRGADRTAADRILARPTTPQEYPGDPRDIVYPEDAELQSTCDANLCVHWVEEGEHAATSAYAAGVFSVLQHVASTYAAAGLKRPLPDNGEEGGTQTDIYLGELEEVGALGFCRSDEGPVVGSAYAAFCGIDNDFEFYGGWPGIMQATVAHEYFHAVQYAYDAEDDGWIYESTAAWIEDEVFDDVDDSAFFLNFGQMGDPNGPFQYPFAGPAFPLDVLDDFGGFNTYGNWGFWRFLTERHPAEEAGIPTLVRDFWRALDTTAGANSTTSRQALDAVLAARRDTTSDAYAGFATANQSPADFYEEGYQYPTAPDGFDPVELSEAVPTATRSVVLDHLTSASGVATPFGTGWNLQIKVIGPTTAYSRVGVIVHHLDGSVSTKWIKVNRRGGTGVVPFSSDDVTSVEVTVANGGTADGQAASIRFQAVD